MEAGKRLAPFSLVRTTRTVVLVLILIATTVQMTLHFTHHNLTASLAHEPCLNTGRRHTSAQESGKTHIPATTETAVGASRANGSPHTLYHLLLMYKEVPPKALCTAESLIKATEGSNVTVWIWADPGWESNKGYLSMLGEIRFVIGKTSGVGLEVKTISYTSIFEGTSLATFYDTKSLDAGVPLDAGEHYFTKYDRFGLQSLSDALRLGILWHHGGFYLDSDIVVIRNPGLLSPGFATELIVNRYSNHAMYFNAPKHPMVGAYISYFTNHYGAWQWGSTGPPMLTHAYAAWVDSCQSNNTCFECTPWAAIVASPISHRKCEKLLLGVRSRNLTWEERMWKETSLVHVHNHQCGQLEDDMITAVVNKTRRWGEEKGGPSHGGKTYTDTLLGSLRTNYCPHSAQRMLDLAVEGALRTSSEKRKDLAPGQGPAYFWQLNHPRKASRQKSLKNGKANEESVG